MKKYDLKSTLPFSLPDGYKIGVDNILDSYLIQLVEEEQRKEGQLNLSYYFDTYDVVNLIHGVLSYLTPTHIDFQKYKQDRLQNLVYAFVFHGFYKPTTIRMLESHKIEFFNKIYSGNLKEPSQKDKYRSIVSEVLSNLIDQSLYLDQEINSQNIDALVQGLITDSAEFFRINFLLQYLPWKRRFKYLQKNDIIKLGTTLDELPVIENIDVFNIINEGFKQIRPTNKESNFYDALAFYQLYTLLKKHKDDPNQPLPVFFASSPTIQKVFKWITENSSNYNLFYYTAINEGREQQIPIIRESLFFALEPIFTISDKLKNTGDFFERLREAQPIIKNLIHEQYQGLFENFSDINEGFQSSKEQIEQNIKDIIEIRFAQRIWVDEKVKTNFIDDLKDLVKWTESNADTVEEKIQTHLTNSVFDAEKSLLRSRQFAVIIRAFTSVNQDVENVLRKNTYIHSLDIFKDFALIRFGIDNRNFSHLQSDVESLIYEEDPINTASPALYKILYALSRRVDSVQKAKEFLNSLAIAWILNKHNLIIELCQSIENQDLEYRYETALIYGASLAAYQRNESSIFLIQKIIACILKNKDQTYKVWIGVSFLYFQIWEIRNSMNREFPEMNYKEWEKVSSHKDYHQFVIDGALLYAKKGYEYLKGKLTENISEVEYKIYLTYFLYVLNNLIYYTTKSGSTKLFIEVEPYADELKRYELNQAEWQGRFFDTLGWYSLRKSYQMKEYRFKNIYIRQAETYLNRAKEKIASSRDYTIYGQLEDAIIKTQVGNS